VAQQGIDEDWLMWRLRDAMPRRSAWRVGLFGTLRLIKLAAIVELTVPHVHLTSGAPPRHALSVQPPTPHPK